MCRRRRLEEEIEVAREEGLKENVAFSLTTALFLLPRTTANCFATTQSDKAKKRNKAEENRTFHPEFRTLLLILRKRSTNKRSRRTPGNHGKLSSRSGPTHFLPGRGETNFKVSGKRTKAFDTRRTKKDGLRSIVLP